jgi:uncharacterized OB-fold protein
LGDARGTGVVHSKTTIRRQVGAALSPAATLVPSYDVATVELDEGPRMLARLVGDSCKIGDRVRVTWRRVRRAGDTFHSTDLMNSRSRMGELG